MIDPLFWTRIAVAEQQLHLRSELVEARVEPAVRVTVRPRWWFYLTLGVAHLVAWAQIRRAVREAFPGQHVSVRVL